MKASHCREVVGEHFGVSCLKLLDEELHIGLNDFFGGLRLGRGGKAVTLLVVAALFMVDLLSVGLALAFPR